MSARATTEVTLVCEDVDLENEIGGSAALLALATPQLCRQARIGALDDVIDHLRNRTPPVLEANLADVSELRIAVRDGALARLYRQNMTTGDGEDVNARKAKDYQAAFMSAVNRLRPTLSGQLKAGPASIALHRR